MQGNGRDSAAPQLIDGVAFGDHVAFFVFQLQVEHEFRFALVRGFVADPLGRPIRQSAAALSLGALAALLFYTLAPVPAILAAAALAFALPGVATEESRNE